MNQKKVQIESHQEEMAGTEQLENSKDGRKSGKFKSLHKEEALDFVFP